MKKIVLINFIFILLVFLATDYIVFKMQKTYFKCQVSYIQNMTKKIAKSDADDISYLKNDFEYRTPQNLIRKDGEKNTLKPIVYLGCSFVYGQFLKEEETISYRTSKLIDNPVYNLGIVSRAINTVIGLLEYGIFFELIDTEPAAVLYTYADFHPKRLVMPNMPYELNEFLYKIKNNKLIRKKPPFIISRFSLLSLIREHIYVYNLDNSPKYRKYLQQLLKIHFIEAKRLINNKYPNTKFIILVYSHAPLFEEIALELEKEGFIIIRINEEEFGLDPYNKEYQLPDGHPNAKVWEAITPKLVEKIKPYL